MKKFITLLVAMVIAAMYFSSCHVQTTDQSEKGSVGVAVDLGLPSGTLWADRNVGASSPEDDGDYFAWGETTTKSNYDFATYKYRNVDYDKLAKNCRESDYGNKDNTGSCAILDRSDDASTINWGSDWCIPTQQQFQELKENCTWTWTTLNGKDGYDVKGKNGNSLFLPAAGYRDGTSFGNIGSVGLYRSSSRRNLFFDSDCVNPFNLNDRICGQSVRPVRCK